jgi:G protein-coupled receptor family C group 6 protein A
MQISYASSAEVLSNRVYYPSYFRTSPSEIVLTPGLANLVQYFGWRQVTFITEEQSLFQDVSYAIISHVL